jgi:hypothetical protein
VASIENNLFAPSRASMALVALNRRLGADDMANARIDVAERFTRRRRPLWVDGTGV